MKSIYIFIAFSIFNIHLEAMEQTRSAVSHQTKYSATRRQQSFDGTRDHGQCCPNMYKLGCETLQKCGERYISAAEKYDKKHGYETLWPVTTYSIGSDDGAHDRWTIVAQGIIKRGNPTWYARCFDVYGLRKAQSQALSLVAALRKKGMSLDVDIMAQLRSVGQVEQNI